jgi:mutator protein MutT
MSRTWPVSVKGVVCRGDTLLLARNDRDEWELPGGRLELGETPQSCVAREIAEEAGLAVAVGPILSSWVFEVVPDQHVLVIAYGCEQLDPDAVPVVSAEHSDVAFVELGRTDLPAGYRAAIDAWLIQRMR